VRDPFKYLILASISILAVSCAVKESPPGGPEDREPPGIVKVDPEPGSTNISIDSRFTVTFSKPMDRTKTESSVFLSPVFWDFPKMKWSGKSLTVIPPEKLEPGKTYVLTVGSDCEGYHRNKMGKSYSFAFSTGPEIDSGSIAGAVFSVESGRLNYDIWAYGISDTASVEFLTEIPDYATQVDSLGGFAISNVSPGRYLVVAVDDRNDDLFWEPTTESIGLPPFILSVSGEAFSGLVLRPDRRDTSLAYISKARPVDNRKLEVEFSQPVDRALKLDQRSYRIESLDEPDTLDVLGIYEGEQGKLVIETGLQTGGRQYKLHADGLRSIWGNDFDTTGARFEGSGIGDSLGPDLISEFPRNLSSDTYQDSVIELTFSERINPLGFYDAVSVVADSVDTLPFAPAWINPNKVRLRFGEGLPRRRRIEVAITPGTVFDAVGNPFMDTTATFSFVLPPADTVGSVSATVNSGGAGPVIGILTSMVRSDRMYESVWDDSGVLFFETVLPGAYWFEFFVDSDGNGKWSPGVIGPFKPAERFGFLADSVAVRSRWTTNVGTVQLPGPAGEKD
jgi:uncharacterized protein (DUF2141 family)